MKKSELRQLIREEIQLLNEFEKPSDQKRTEIGKARRLYIAAMNDFISLMTPHAKMTHIKKQIAKAKKQIAAVKRAKSTGDEKFLQALSFLESAKGEIRDFQHEDMADLIQLDPKKVKKFEKSMQTAFAAGVSGNWGEYGRPFAMEI